MSAGARAAATRLHTTFIVTAALGGALLGGLQAAGAAVLTELSVGESARRLAALALLALLFVRQRKLVELRRWGLNLIVPASMVDILGARTGAVWGLALGSGVVTQVPNATIPAYLVTGCLLVRDPWLLVGIGVLFGLARALPGVIGPVREALIVSTERTLAGAAGGTVSAGTQVTRLASQSVLLLCIVALALRSIAG